MVELTGVERAAVGLEPVGDLGDAVGLSLAEGYLADGEAG